MKTESKTKRTTKTTPPEKPAAKEIAATPAKPATPEKATKGRAAFIHSLKAQGLKQSEALARTQEKFDCSKGLFARIWERKGINTTTTLEAK